MAVIKNRVWVILIVACMGASGTLMGCQSGQTLFSEKIELAGPVEFENPTFHAGSIAEPDIQNGMAPAEGVPDSIPEPTPDSLPADEENTNPNGETTNPAGETEYVLEMGEVIQPQFQKYTIHSEDSELSQWQEEVLMLPPQEQGAETPDPNTEAALIEALENKINELATALEAWQTERQQVLAAIKIGVEYDTGADLVALNQKLKQIEANIEQTNEELNAVKDELMFHLLSEEEKNIVLLKRELAALEKEKMQLEQKLFLFVDHGSEADLESIKNSIADKVSEIDSLKEQIATLELSLP